MDNMYHEQWIRDLLPNLVKEGKFSNEFEKFTKIKNCEISRLSSTEGFMLTMCYRITITLTDDMNNNSKEFKLVLKATPPCPEVMYHAANFTTLFQNEIVAYTKMFPILGWNRYVSSYYYSEVKDLEAKILLGDFGLENYRMSKAKGNLSLEHIIESVKLIGEFHGVAYALKNNDRKAFDELKNQFSEARHLYEAPPEYKIVLNHGPIRAIRSVRAHQDECKIPEEFLKKLEELFEDVQPYQKENYKAIEPFAILCHGDFLRNNIAFKYSDNETDVPETAMMFDFQTFRYTSPMHDLTTFMFVSTGIDVRSKHFDEIFQTYYKVLIDTYCSRTKTNETDIPEYLTYTFMMKEYIRNMPYAFSVASSFIAMCLNPIDDIMSINKNEAFLEMLITSGGELVDRELRALVCDMYRLFTENHMELA